MHLYFASFVALLAVINAAEDYGDYENYQDYENYEDYENKFEVEYVLQSISLGKLTALTEKSCAACNCGIPNRLTRIVGGWMTEVHEYPWMVALSRNGHFFCGGTLINDRYVLTAAHCVARTNNISNTEWVTSTVRVILAEHNHAQMGETMTESSAVQSVTVHPKFSRATFDYDLALLRLERKMKFRRGLRTACLPPKTGDYVGEFATVAGWGLTMEGGRPSAYLRETTVPILSLNQCRQRGYRPSRITQNMICAGDYNNMDSCQGDSGGALLVTNDFHQMMTVGIVSWGEGCARPQKPGVYTRVDKHVDWILDNTKDACYCY